MQEQTPAKPVSKSGPVWWYRWVSILTAVLLLIQPILAGQFAYNEKSDLEDVHQMAAYIIFLTAMGQLILAYMARRTYGVGLVGHNAGLFVLVVAQIGLGEVGKDHPGQLAYHIPLGVLLFGMGCMAPLMGFFDLRAQRRL
jgi:peptidoglycan/LPS O-acetylase OafA/YrhL